MHKDSPEAGILCELAPLGSWALDKRMLCAGSILPSLVPPPSSRQQLNLSGTLGTAPDLLRFNKNSLPLQTEDIEMHRQAVQTAIQEAYFRTKYIL